MKQAVHRDGFSSAPRADAPAGDYECGYAAGPRETLVTSGLPAAVAGSVRRRHAVSRIELDADTATAWFRAHGWEIVGELSRDFRAFADEITLVNVRLTRVWHTPASFVRKTPAAPVGDTSGRAVSPRPATAILQVNGTSALSLTPGASLNELGGGICVSGRRPLRRIHDRDDPCLGRTRGAHRGARMVRE